MGRKIPGKKHRGVKDPYKQHAQRLAALKTKINKTPVRLDDQPIPKSLVQLMSWKNKNDNRKDTDVGFKSQSTSNKANLKKGKKISKQNVSNPIKKLRKLDGESKKSFNVRINDALKTLKKESTFNDIINDMPKEIVKKGENTEKIDRKRKRKINKNEIRLTKSQKRSQKEKEKKEQVKEKEEFEKLYVIKKDVVQFGEIVHEPPSLKIKPRKAETADGAPRPARKDLLLNKMFESNNIQAISHNINNIRNNDLLTIKKKNIDLKGKRKDLPVKIRSQLEESRKNAIEAYKKIKLLEKNKQKQEL